jgi:hypothetical protein
MRNSVVPTPTSEIIHIMPRRKLGPASQDGETIDIDIGVNVDSESDVDNPSLRVVQGPLCSPYV